MSILSLDRTTDGGRGWQRSAVRLVTPNDSQAVPLLGFSDASHGWLVFGSTTRRTSNGGLTWTRS